MVSWPWGSLVGAILILAGVLALKHNGGEVREAAKPSDTYSGALSTKQSSTEDPETLAMLIKEMRERGEAVPDDLIARAQTALDKGKEDWFQNFETLLSKNDRQVVDLTDFAETFRVQNGFPLTGPVLGHPAATEETDFVLTTIERFGGKVPLREAIFMRAVLEEGQEAEYLRERLKRGYPSLYDNSAKHVWSDSPGYYERQLQLRHNNPLFPAHKQCVSQHDVYIARQLDAQEQEEFFREWKDCLERIVKGQDFIATSDAINHLHELHSLIEKAALLGMDSGETVENIRQTYRSILSALYEGLKSQPEATRSLQEAEQTRWAGSELRVSGPVQQLLRIEDASDVIPWLMTHDVAVIAAVVATLDESRLRAVRDSVVSMMNDRPLARKILEREPLKLEAIGLDLRQSAAS